MSWFGKRRNNMFAKQIMAVALSGALLLGSSSGAFADSTDRATAQSPTPVVKQTPEQLQQLVAPIALYPDELVAEVLAAATYPAQVVEEDRWLQQHRGLTGTNLA